MSDNRSSRVEPFVHRNSDLRRVLHRPGFCQSLLLIDPSTQAIDYGAGVLDARAVRKLFDIQRNGAGLGVWADRRKTAGNWFSEHDFGASFGFVAGLVGLGLAATTVPIASAWNFFVTGAGVGIVLVLAVIGASRFVVPRANRRIDALHEMVKAVEVQLPTYSADYHDHSPEDARIGHLRERLCYKTMDLREKWLKVRKSRKVTRAAKAEMAAEMDLVLYAIARAAKEPTVELGDVVIARSEALIARFERVLTPPDALPPVIEAPQQTRTDDQLIRDLTGDIEPQTVEYDAHPQIAAYPHAREVR